MTAPPRFRRRGATHFVDPAGPEDATHFLRIQDALEAAPDGALIAVAPGTYAEALEARSNVTIVGRCAEEVVVVGHNLEGSGLRAGGHNVEARGLTFVGHPRGLRVDTGGTLTASAIVIEGARGLGAIASGDGARLVLSDSVIRNMMVTADGLLGPRAAGPVERPRRALGGLGRTERRTPRSTPRRSAARSSPSAWSSPTPSIGTRSTATACTQTTAPRSKSKTARSSAPGTPASSPPSAAGASSTGVVLRDGFASGQPNSPGIIVWLGSTVEAERVMLSGGVEENVLVEDGGSRLTLRDSVVTKATQVNFEFGGGIIADSAANLTLEGTAVVGNPDFAVMMLKTSASITRSVIGRSETTPEGFGLLLWDEAEAEVVESQLGGSPLYDLQVSRGAGAAVRRSVVTDGTLGAFDGCRLDVEGTLIENARDNGIRAEGEGTFVAVSNSVIRGTRIATNERVGEGLLLLDGASGQLVDSEIVNNQNRGVTVGAGGHARSRSQRLPRDDPGPDGIAGLRRRRAGHVHRPGQRVPRQQHLRIGDVRRR